MGIEPTYVVEAVDEADKWTNPISPCLDLMPDHPGYGALNLSIAGTFSGTVTLQRRFGQYGDWRAVETYTSETETRLVDTERIVQYRLGIDDGDYSSGTANCRLGSSR